MNSSRIRRPSPLASGTAALVLSICTGCGPGSAPGASFTTTPTSTSTTTSESSTTTPTSRPPKAAPKPLPPKAAPKPAPPKPVPEPVPQPVPHPRRLQIAASSFSDLGPARVGMTMREVEAVLGVVFVEGGVQFRHGGCFAIVESVGRIGVVVDGGVVQAFLIRIPGIPLTAFTKKPIEVGARLEAVGASYPRWYGGPGSYVSRFNGPRTLVAPAELNSGFLRSAGRAALFEADEDGVIQQIRVGSTPYVDHVDYCTTPE